MTPDPAAPGALTSDELVVVSGLPRSGTSLMMRMLEAGGLPILTDAVRAADEDNPRGYYEYEPVKRLKADPAVLEPARGKVVKIISELLRLVPPQYPCRVIVMRRAMPEILASQRQMLIRRGKPADAAQDAELATLFERHLRRLDEWLQQQPHMRVLDIHYNTLLDAPAEPIAQVNRFLGGSLDTARMAQVIDQGLYRQRR
jgi:hypothetical protein